MLNNFLQYLGFGGQNVDPNMYGPPQPTLWDSIKDGLVSPSNQNSNPVANPSNDPSLRQKMLMQMMNTYNGQGNNVQGGPVPAAPMQMPQGRMTPVQQPMSAQNPYSNNMDMRNGVRRYLGMNI